MTTEQITKLTLIGIQSKDSDLIFNNDSLLAAIREYFQEYSISLTFAELLTEDFKYEKRFKEIIVNENIMTGEKVKAALSAYITLLCSEKQCYTFILPISYLVFNYFSFSFNIKPLHNISISDLELINCMNIYTEIVKEITFIYTSHNS